MLLKIKAYLALMRLDRPIGILLLLWPTYWALWLAAQGRPEISLLVVFTVGVIVMRSAGCVINDILDRKFDPYVQRTCQRPLAAGLISVRQALIVFFILCGFAFCLLYWLNPFTQLLSIIGLLLAVIYPLLKRYCRFPQLGLGFAFSWGIPMAFAAQTNKITLVAWILCLINCLWAIAYDTEYAMADRDDDIKIGVKSTAILFGNYDYLVIGLLQISILSLLWGLANWLNFNSVFKFALLMGLFLFIYQQWLIQKRERQDYLSAFINNHWFGMIIFLGVFCQYCHRV
jgi:4-hydroxybenzoate polyprenyltransferase